MSLSTGGRFRVIAADQSDCFCGASVYCSDGFHEAMRVRRSASSVPLLVDVIFRDSGPPAIRRACAEVRATVPRIQEALELVPPAWWNLSSRRPADVREILEFRASHLEEILNPNQWGVPNADNQSSFSYAIFRFVKDAHRDISVPVGVALWTKGANWVARRLVRPNEKVRHLSRTADYPFIQIFAKNLEEWLTSNRLPYSEGAVSHTSDA